MIHYCYSAKRPIIDHHSSSDIQFNGDPQCDMAYNQQNYKHHLLVLANKQTTDNDLFVYSIINLALSQWRCQRGFLAGATVALLVGGGGE